MVSFETVYIAYFDLLGVRNAIIQGGLVAQAERLDAFYAVSLFEGLDWGQLCRVGGFSDCLYIEAETSHLSADYFVEKSEQTFERLYGLENAQFGVDGPGLRGFVAKGERISTLNLSLGVFQPQNGPKLEIVPTSTAMMKAYLADNQGSGFGFKSNCLYIEDEVLHDAERDLLSPQVPLAIEIDGQQHQFANFICYVNNNIQLDVEDSTTTENEHG